MMMKKLYKIIFLVAAIFATTFCYANIPTNAKFRSVIFNRVTGEFIAVGDEGLVATSVNGVVWNLYRQGQMQGENLANVMIPKTGPLEGKIVAVDAGGDYWVSENDVNNKYVAFKRVSKRNVITVSHEISARKVAVSYYVSTSNGISEVWRYAPHPDGKGTDASRIYTINGDTVDSMAVTDDDTSLTLIITDDRNEKHFFISILSPDDVLTPRGMNRTFVPMQSAMRAQQSFCSRFASGKNIIASCGKDLSDGIENFLLQEHGIIPPAGTGLKVPPVTSQDVVTSNLTAETDFGPVVEESGKEEEEDEVVDLEAVKKSSLNYLRIYSKKVLEGKMSNELVTSEVPGEIAPRTCLAGGIINNQKILVSLGEDNIVLFSTDFGRRWNHRAM